MNIPVIAIDGPAASGKGTVAAGVASRLGFHLLDSGALYRLVAYEALAKGIDVADEQALAAIAARLPVKFVGDAILLDGADVTAAIRGEDVSAAASHVAVHRGVRAA